MRPAPPLGLRCSASRPWRLGCAAIGALAACSVSAWAAGHLEWPSALRILAVLAAVPFGAAVGLVAAGPKADVLIAWDGQRWTVDGVAGTLQVMLDLDRWLLLLRHAEAPARRVRWVALSFGRGGDEHRALRAALYSSPPEATP